MTSLIHTIHTEVWICSICGHKQSVGFIWCGKNLRCQGCGDYSYYRECKVIDK